MGWGYGWGWGWNPFLWGGQNTLLLPLRRHLVYRFNRCQEKNLVWKEGIGYLNKIEGDKEKRINEFVAAILKQYPPQVK
jgi:hypothetical protein